MSSENARSLSGRLAVVAGVIYMSLGVFFLFSAQRSDDYRFPADYLVEGFFALALTVTATAIAMLHVGLAGRYGRLGTIAAGLAVAGHLAMAASATASTIRGADTIDLLIPLGFLVAMIGAIILGIITWRARALPRWSSLLLVIAYPATITLGDNGGLIVLGSVWGAIGYALWSGMLDRIVTDEPAAKPAVR
jgi:hypothetical protein